MTRRTLIISMLAACCVAPTARAASAQPATLPIDDSGVCFMDTAAGRIERVDESGRDYTDEGLSIDQPVIEITRDLRPGDSFTCTITIRNRRPTRATYDISIAGLLGSRTEQTRVVPIDSPDIDATAAAWIDPIASSVTMQPDERASIPFVITVPPNPPRGGVYASIQFVARQRAPSGGEAQIGVTSGAASSLLLHVGGEGRAELAFTDARTRKLRTSRAAWTFRARLDNDGTAVARPDGRVRVRSILGRTVARFDVRTRPLLPSGGAPVSVRWDDTPWFGIYRWDARVGSTGDADAKPARTSGWIIALPPWWVLVAIAAVAIAIATWPIARRRRAWQQFMDDDDDQHSDEDGHDPDALRA